MNDKVMNHDKYLDTLTTKDLDICCNNIIEIVNNVLREIPRYRTSLLGNNVKT